VIMFCLLCCLGVSPLLLSGCHVQADAVPVILQETNPQSVPEVEVHRPTRLPDRIVLTWAGDPSRSQAVTWRSDPSVAVGLAEIAVADDNASFAARARQLKAKTTSLTSNLAAAHYHSVEFTALSSRTKYAYRVGDGTNWSEWFHFTTASDQPDPFSFIYFGDSQNDLKSLWSRVIREAFTEAPKARFMLHAGDLINHANSDAQWGEWFQAGGWLNGTIPCVPTPGNHEYKSAANILGHHLPTLSDHWKPQFTLPEHGPPGLEETVYFLDYQGVRIVSLNSNERHADQVLWLESVLRDNPGKWCIVTFHHPIYSSAKQRDNAAQREAWQPLFDKYSVDLVLQGHDHTYARSGLETFRGTIEPSPKKDQITGADAAKYDSAGTVYVVSVSGPKMYDLGRPLRPEFQRVAEDTQLFQIISIEGDQLQYVARTATGQLYDAFRLKKREGQSNQLIEQVPDIPQRLRPPIPEKPKRP